jgi:hypothetical protein
MLLPPVLRGTEEADIIAFYFNSSSPYGNKDPAGSSTGQQEAHQDEHLSHVCAFFPSMPAPSRRQISTGRETRPHTREKGGAVRPHAHLFVSESKCPVRPCGACQSCLCLLSVLSPAQPCLSTHPGTHTHGHRNYRSQPHCYAPKTWLVHKDAHKIFPWPMHKHAHNIFPSVPFSLPNTLITPSTFILPQHTSFARFLRNPSWSARARSPPNRSTHSRWLWRRHGADAFFVRLAGPVRVCCSCTHVTFFFLPVVPCTQVTYLWTGLDRN